MTFDQLKQFLVLECDDGSMERDGFISYVLKDGYVILIQSDRTDSKTFRYATYFQILAADVDGPECLCIQVEGEDPINYLLDVEFEVKIYTRVDVKNGHM